MVDNHLHFTTAPNKKRGRKKREKRQEEEREGRKGTGPRPL